MSRSPDLRPPDPARPNRPDRPARRAGFIPTALVVAVVLGAAACGGGSDDRGGSDGESADAAATTTTVAAEGGTTTSITPTTTVPASAGGAATTEPAGAGEGCGDTQTWGTATREAGQMSAEDVYLVRPGRHDCYDRVVFDVNGVIDGPDAVGFHATYVQGDVQADGSGEPVPTAGDAALQLTVRAPAQGYGTTGHQPGQLLARLGDDLVTADQVAGWPALREVAFAGSFEGQTTFAIGVDEQLPFRVGAFESDGYTHVYVDVAHPQ